jgi:hypothetical protein
MKINQLITDFTVFTTNEEQELLNSLSNDVRPYASFSEREQTVLETLNRKSLVAKVFTKNQCWVMRNGELR